MARILMEEESLQDTEVLFGLGSVSTRMSGFLLSLVSPVLHKMVCGAFKESVSKRLDFGEMEQGAFFTVMRLACAGASVQVKHLTEVVELAKVADRLQMSDVAEALSRAVSRELSVDVCAEMLNACSGYGLVDMEAQCRRFALDHFEQVARTESFMSLGEEIVGGLIDDDELFAGSEEAAFEAIVNWMKGGPEGLRGEGLLRKVRYGLMGNAYLAESARSLLAESELLSDLVSEAEVLKRARPGMRQLGGRPLVARRGRDVHWERYRRGGELRLGDQPDCLWALAEHAGRVFIGSIDGSIQIWNKSTLNAERVLRDNASPSRLWALTWWKGRLISGHSDGVFKVWDVASGRLESTLRGHVHDVEALAVCGEWLVSGSHDRTVKLWGMGEDALLQCERRLQGHTHSVLCLAGWQGKVMSGSADRTVRVWDVQSGEHEATLEGHSRTIIALALAGLRLISADDLVVCAWAVGTWELLQMVDMSMQLPCHPSVLCVTVCGSKLVTGSASMDEYQHCEVRVWDVDSLVCERTLLQPAGADVRALLGMSGEVWGTVDREVVVWGRELAQGGRLVCLFC